MVQKISRFLQKYIILHKYTKKLTQAVKKNIQKFIREKPTLTDFMNTSILLMFVMIIFAPIFLWMITYKHF